MVTTTVGAEIPIGAGTPFPSTTYPQAVAQFDAAMSRTMAGAGCKFFCHTEGSYPAAPGNDSRLNFLYNGGTPLPMMCCVKADRAMTASGQAALGTFLDMLKGHGWTKSNCWVVLWNEPNPSPFAAADYITYVKYYTPVVQKRFLNATCLIVAGNLSNAETLSYYAGSSYVDVIGVDYYGTAYKGGARLDGNDGTANGMRAQAIADGLPFMIGEFGEGGNPSDAALTLTEWNAYIAYLKAQIADQKTRTGGWPGIFYFNGLGTTPSPNPVVPTTMSSTPYNKVPALQSLFDSATGASSSSSAAFTEAQNGGTIPSASGVAGLWFSQSGGTASSANTLVSAQFVANDGSMTMTAPTGWVKRADIASQAGTGVARAIIYDYLNNPGGICGNVSYTATSASPCVFTVTGTAPAATTPIVLSGTVPTGFTAGTVYYVVSPSGSTFEAAATVGGTAINSTTAVTTGGVLAFPQVFTSSNTSVTMTGHLTEFSTPASTVQQVDQISLGGSGTAPTTPLTVTTPAADAYTGGLGIAVWSVHYSAAPSSSWSNASGWNSDRQSAGTGLNQYLFDSRTALPAGSPSPAPSDSPTTGMTDWAGTMVTYAAVAGSTLDLDAQPLPAATISVAYSTTVTASGGVTPYTWTATGLPAGLSMSTSGVISGTPTTAGLATATVTVTDAASNTASVTDSIDVQAAVTVTTTSPLPGGTNGTLYSDTLTASGGAAGGYTWAATGGSLPGGLTLSSAGVVSGTPTAAGTFTVTATATDTEGRTGSASLSLTIAGAGSTPEVTTTGLAAATAGQPYSAQLTETGGAGPFTWAVTSGSLPPGITLNATTGILSGTCTTPGAYTFTITVSD